MFLLVVGSGFCRAILEVLVKSVSGMAQSPYRSTFNSRAQQQPAGFYVEEPTNILFFSAKIRIAACLNEQFLQNVASSNSWVAGQQRSCLLVCQSELSCNQKQSLCTQFCQEIVRLVQYICRTSSHSLSVT